MIDWFESDMDAILVHSVHNMLKVEVSAEEHEREM